MLAMLTADGFAEVSTGVDGLRKNRHRMRDAGGHWHAWML